MPTGGGVWAPTIRHRDGVFYVIVTIAMSPRGCVVFTATDPAGPWSDGITIDGIGGIDPDLAWDDDGTAYVTFSGLHHQRRAARPAPGHPAGAGRPRRRQGARGAALAVVGHRAEVPGGAAPLPPRRLLVPDHRRGRHRARPRRQRRPGSVARRVRSRAPGQPDPQRAQHVPPDPEHRARRPGRHARRRHRAGPARYAPARREPRRSRRWVGRRSSRRSPGSTAGPSRSRCGCAPRDAVDEEIFDFADASALDDPGWLAIRTTPGVGRVGRGRAAVDHRHGPS